MLKLGSVTVDKWEDLVDSDGHDSAGIYARVQVNGQPVKVVFFRYICGHVELIAVGKEHAHYFHSPRTVALLEDHLASAVCTPYPTH